MTAPDELILHPASKAALAPHFSGDLPHALLIYGQPGVGLLTIANALGGAAIVSRISPKNAKDEVDPAGTISVETMRQLYDQTKTKYQGHRVVIIDDADRMSHGAQSAFLKLLEEPGEGISFILTSHQPERLLPTIRSRVQAAQLQPITADQTARFIAQLGVTEQVRRIQLRYIADGLPAELHRLVHNEELFTNRASVVGDARDFLQGDSYRKALIVQKYKGDRTSALQLIDSAMAILRKTMSAKPEDRIAIQLDDLLKTRESLEKNGNIGLQLMRFVL